MTDAELIAAGYDAVYRAYPGSRTLARIWREGTQEPGAEHLDQISFVTVGELKQLTAALSIVAEATLLDLGCGTGGPGLWIATNTGARLIGLDVSTVAVARAAERAERLGNSAQFREGSLEHTGLDDAIADAAISIDVFHYLPDKLAALREVARVLRPGARIAFTAFELDRRRAASLPIFGADPVSDLRPLLEQAGFAVETYVETVGWRERVTTVFEAVLAAQGQLAKELGPEAGASLAAEAHIALQARIYRRRVLAAARRIA